jgi:hypothetical protein
MLVLILQYGRRQQATAVAAVAAVAKENGLPRQAFCLGCPIRASNG